MGFGLFCLVVVMEVALMSLTTAQDGWGPEEGWRHGLLVRSAGLPRFCSVLPGPPGPQAACVCVVPGWEAGPWVLPRVPHGPPHREPWRALAWLLLSQAAPLWKGRRGLSWGSVLPSEGRLRWPLRVRPLAVELNMAAPPPIVAVCLTLPPTLF